MAHVEGGAPKARGLSLLHWLQSFEKHYGADARAEMLSRVPGEARVAIEAGLDSAGWYPLSWYSALLSAARDVAAGGVDVVETLARTSAKAEFTGIHRVLLLFVSPQRLLRISRRVFDRYYTHGCVETIARGRTEADVRWSGCRGFDDNIWHDCFVAAAVAVELCGAKDVEWTITKGAGNAEDATVHYRWK